MAAFKRHFFFYNTASNMIQSILQTAYGNHINPIFATVGIGTNGCKHHQERGRTHAVGVDLTGQFFQGGRPAVNQVVSAEFYLDQPVRTVPEVYHDVKYVE